MTKPRDDDPDLDLRRSLRQRGQGACFGFDLPRLKLSKHLTPLSIKVRRDWAASLADGEEEVTGPKVKRRCMSRPASSKSSTISLSSTALTANADRWEQCRNCGEWTSLGQAPEQKCLACSAPVVRQSHRELQYWILCEDCGKWRATTAEIARQVDLLESRSRPPTS